jgi:hypothetical protein
MTDNNNKMLQQLQQMQLFLYFGYHRSRNSFLGVLLEGDDFPDAEIIPVEPGQGNACAGKVSGLISSFCFRSISLNSFFQNNRLT